MNLFILLLSSSLLYLGYTYIYAVAPTLFLMYVIFVLLNVAIIHHFLKVKDISQTLVYVFCFVGWLFYSSLGLVRDAYILGQDCLQESDVCLEYYIYFIMATFLLYIPTIIIRRRTKGYKGFKYLPNIRLSERVLIICITLTLGLQLYKVHLAGGWLDYFFAAYGHKIDTSYMTFFHLFLGIMTNTLYIVLPFIVLKCRYFIKIIAIVYVIFDMLMGFMSGSSTSLLNIIIVFFTYLYLTTLNKNKRKKVKRAFLIFAIVGVIMGVLIRQNRISNDEFTFEVLKTSVEDVLESPTFDSATNLRYVLSNWEPNYNLNNFIYPYVNYLPRTVFSWKPMEMGRIISVEMKGLDIDSLTGFIPSAIGEFYFDFGIIGIIFGMLFCSIVFSVFQEKMNNTSNGPYKYPFLIAFCLYTTILSGWYTGSFLRLVRLYLFYLLFFFLSKSVGNAGANHKFIRNYNK